MKLIQIIKNSLSIKKLNYILIVLIIILCLANIFFHIRNTVDFEKIQETITRQPESFTELYFENHNDLPNKLASPDQYTWYDNPNTNLYTFSFTIHNHENKDMKYTYEVYTLEKTKSLIDTGEVFVGNNQSKTIKVNFSYPLFHERTKVIVSLLETKQDISFWIDKNIYENQ